MRIGHDEHWGGAESADEIVGRLGLFIRAFPRACILGI